MTRAGPPLLRRGSCPLQRNVHDMTDCPTDLFMTHLVTFARHFCAIGSGTFAVPAGRRLDFAGREPQARAVVPARPYSTTS